ncbi:serine hydrolase domain-containing protein [Beutenbergia cavernae]|uniref:serine hydrolase domain-containing protein n=1 Tax=Beutenbergia cavernae TaxID=84757 RepID=UPI001651064F|nr:serine hydrolase domain-containing protein [Beutenbergia cavernae]
MTPDAPPALATLARETADAVVAGRLAPAAIVAIRTPAGEAVAAAGAQTYDDGAPLVDADAVVDLASLTKAYVATTVLTLAERGVLDMDAPVSPLLAVGRGEDADAITLRHLLTHTSGLPAVSFAWRDVEGEALFDAVLASDLEAAPGERFTYSCLGYVAAGRLAEIATGRPLADLVAELVAVPVGARTLQYGPVGDGAAVLPTEVEPHRGLVRGAVHDEMAHAFGRPVGNAGLFGTAADLLALGGGLLGDGGISPAVVAALSTDALGPLGTRDLPGYGQSLGLRIGDAGFMGGVDGVGHTGFTGTSLVVDRERGTVAVLLTNRVHPSRERSDVGPSRAALADAVALLADGAGAGAVTAERG